MHIFGGRIFGKKKTPLKITILGGRIFGEGGGSASPLLPIYPKDFGRKNILVGIDSECLETCTGCSQLPAIAHVDPPTLRNTNR